MIVRDIVLGLVGVEDCKAFKIYDKHGTLLGAGATQCPSLSRCYEMPVNYAKYQDGFVEIWTKKGLADGRD